MPSVASNKKRVGINKCTENPKYPHSKRAVTERPSLPVYKNKGHIQRRHRGGAAADRMTAAHRCPNLEGSRFFVRVQVPMQNQRKNLFIVLPQKSASFERNLPILTSSLFAEMACRFIAATANRVHL